MRLCAFVLLLLSCFTVPTFAQTATGTLHGRVTDPSKAVVPTAVVTATNAAGKTFTVQTDHQGEFQFTRLAPGSYNVTVQAKGFAVDQEPGVTVLLDRHKNSTSLCRLRLSSSMSRCRKNRRQ